MQEKIKIALMSYAMDERRAKGTALYTRKLIEGLLQNNKFNFTLVHYNKVVDPLYLKAGEIVMPRVVLPYGSHFVSQLLFFWKYRNNQFDIIHWFQPRVYPFYWLAPAKKIVVTMHGAGDITAPQNFVFSRLVFNFVLKHFHKHISKVVVVSLDAKSEVVKHYNFSPDEVIAIYNGGGEDYKPIEKKEAQKLIAEKYKIIGSYILDISRFIPHKNVPTLIKAYNIFREKNPSRNEKLVVVGGSGDKNSCEYKARAGSSFAKDIVFVDFVDALDLNSIYSGAELFVFPSLSEGFGLPVLEAMASGTPVITSNIASMGEIGEEAVVTVNPLDYEGLATVMHQTLINPEKMAKMRDLGLQRARVFTWAKMVEKTENLYQELK